ncbi:hypothetical protein Micbo1qcDRAFT_170648 [Microdochium bolleyi]|uniref:Uncharacterized protein n=1 Tax=Microdochium bolleyi TaxID=196109 RepID=A0A136JIB1_9PEZI|nr:hypothetical protein Micbo1qcDRAFT_170648 [Microdochium bolleyi]
MAGVTMSQRELQVIAAAWQSIEGEPKRSHPANTISTTTAQIDYDKFTTLAGYGSVESARVSWRNLRKKLFSAADGTVASTPKSSSGPRKGSGSAARSRKTATPSAAALVVKKEVFSPDDDEADNSDELCDIAEAQGTPTKPKRRRPVRSDLSPVPVPPRKKGRVATIKEYMAAVKKEENGGEDADGHGNLEACKLEDAEGGKTAKFSLKLEELTGAEEA